MFKSVQFRIILIYFVIGILIISGLGIFFLQSINTLRDQIQVVDLTQDQITNAMTQLENNTTAILVIATLVFTVVGIMVAIFLSRYVIYPIRKLNGNYITTFNRWYNCI